MLRLSSRQALKSLRNPLHNLPTNTLRGPLRARHLQNTLPLHDAAPFSVPPSYVAIARRWSSSRTPISFLAKKDEEARKRGEFVDVHNIGGVNPKDFDVLITDINNHTLHSDISELIGIPYLKEATNDEADKVVTSAEGIVYGQLARNILPCVLRIGGKARWVFFLVDTGSPLTYISYETVKSLGLERESGDPWRAKLAGYDHRVFMSPMRSQFSSINLLGNDFCWEKKLRAWHDGDEDSNQRAITYYIGEKWARPAKL